MTSVAARLMPLVITMRGSKARFRSVESTRRDIAQVAARPAAFAPPRSLLRRASIVQQMIDGWPVYSVSPMPQSKHPFVAVPDAASGTPSHTEPDAPTSLYLHGGSWVHEIGRSHWNSIVALVERSGSTVVVPIYPLAPTGTAATVIPQVAGLARRFGATALVGDSAGATIALAAAVMMRDAAKGNGQASDGGVPAPGVQTILISPGLDLTLSDPRVAELGPSDPFLALPGIRHCAALWAGDWALDDPRVSPLFADLAGLAPITVFTGTRDILNPDAHRLVERAHAAGVPVTLHEQAGLLHDYPLMPTPEGRTALGQIARLLR